MQSGVIKEWFYVEKWSRIAGLGLWISGNALGLSVPVRAQTPGSAVTLASVTGTWEQIPDLSTRKWGANLSSPVIYRQIMIRSDNSLSERIITVFRGDTLASCGNTWGIKVTESLEDFSLGKGADGIQQLIWIWRGKQGAPDEREVFRRVDLSSPVKEPFARLLAAGYGLGGRPVPVHAPKPTGTLADLWGTWGLESSESPIVMVRPDTTRLEVGRDNQLQACAWEESLALARTGDTIRQVGADGLPSGRGYVFHDQQLIEYPEERFFPDTMFARWYPKLTKDQVQPKVIYKPVDAPKRP